MFLGNKRVCSIRSDILPIGQITLRYGVYKNFQICYAVDKWVSSPKGDNHSMSAQSPVLRGFELFLSLPF